MRIRTINSFDTNETQFIVTITDTEWQVKEYRKLRAFEDLIFTYLARMISAYWFKKNKDLILEITEISKQIVAERIAEDILNRMGIALKGSGPYNNE